MKTDLKTIISLMALTASVSIYSASAALAQATQITDVRKAKAKVVLETPTENKGGHLASPMFSEDKPFSKLIDSQNHQVKRFDNTPLTPQQISNILFTANGKTENGTTISPINNISMIEIYAVSAEGTFRWDPQLGSLQKLQSEDLRNRLGDGENIASAPISLVLIANFDNYYKAMGSDKMPMQQLLAWAGIEAGQIMQNISLACANMELASVVSTPRPDEKLHQELRLDGKTVIIAIQSVGMNSGK